MQTNTFIFAWDMHGLECCINLTEIEHSNLLDVLKDNNPQSINMTLNGLLLRAKYNSHRHYEIYSCQVDHTIEKQDLVTMFVQNPQQAADLIRSLGTEIYSDRLDKSKVAIT